MGEKDFSEIARLSERFNKDPKSKIFVQLADAYRKNNMIDEALEILNKGLAFHPNYPLAHLILGKCNFDKRKLEQAKESFKKTLSFDPQNIVALRMLAQTCEAGKDEDGQIEAYKGILAIDPFDAPAKEKLTQLESLRRKEPLYTVAMAEEYEKQGDLEKALSIYENLSFTTPNDLVLEQKATELKKKIDVERKKLEEEKIEGLQLDTYFRAEDLDQKTEPEPTQTEEVGPKATPEPTSAPEQIAEIKSQGIFPSDTGEKPEEVVTRQDEQIHEPTEAAQVIETTEKPETEEPAGLDLLEPIEPATAQQDETPSQPVEKTETVESTETPEVQIAEPDILQPVETTEQPPEPEQETQTEEIMGAEDLLQPLEPVEEPPAETGEPEIPKLVDIAEPEQKTEPQQPPTEEPSEKLGEAEDLLKPVEEVKEIKDEPAAETTEPSPAPTAEVDKAETDEPKEEVPPATPQAETEPIKESAQAETTSGKATDVSQPPPESPPAKPKEKPEAKKPPEEDFQSFKDWLGGLLK